MANLQYIGARYVPKFYENSIDPSSNEWEAGVNYEPLVVVKYLDDEYTSKIPVPQEIGNPVDNPTYWAKTFNYNATIAAIQNEIGNINNEIGNETILTENSSINDALYDAFVKAANSPRASIFKKYQNFAKTYFDAITGTSGMALSMQAAAYDSKRDVFCFGIMNGNDTTEGYLVTVNPSAMTTVVNSRHFTANELGHCGPMAYDPVRDRYVTVKNGDLTKLYVFSAATLQQIATVSTGIDPGDANVMHGITYDVDNDVYYAPSFTGMYTLDGNLTVIDYRMFDFDFRTVSDVNSAYATSHALNGVHYDNGFFYITLMHQDQRARLHNLYKLDFNLKTIAVYDISKTSNSFEFEDITSVDGEILLFGYFDVITEYVLRESPHISENTLEVFHANGVALPENADLDTDAFDTGVYTYRDTRSLTIANAPFTGDTTIISIPLHNRQTQIVIGGHNTNPRIVARVFNSSANTWGEFKPLTLENLVRNMSTSYEGIYSGYIDSSGNPIISIENTAFVSSSVRDASTITFDGTIYCTSGSTVTVTTSDTISPIRTTNCLGMKVNLATPLTALANTPITARGTANITIA